MNNKLLALLTLLMITLKLYAFPGLVMPELPATYTYQCNDCHVLSNVGPACNMNSVHPISPCLNIFGRDYYINGWSDSLRDLDSDGDGTNNGFELNGGSSAGFPDGAESVGCNTLSAVTNPGTYYSCGNPNIEIKAMFSSSLTNSYTFSFKCVLGSGPVPALSDTNWADRCLYFEFMIGGTITGLGEGETIALLLNSSETLVLDSNAAYLFIRTLHINDIYAVTITDSPVNKTCEIFNDTGNMPNNDISNIDVDCKPLLIFKSGFE